MSHGFYQAYQHSGGAEWKTTASFPPMLYPTHSTSMIISVTGARLTHVSCFGQVDEEGDGVFEEDVSLWRNVYSNQVALYRTSDGGTARVMELRRIGLPQGNSNRMNLYGTRASFEEQWYARFWVDRDDQAKRVDLTEALACRRNRAVPEAELREIPEALRDDFFAGVSSRPPRPPPAEGVRRPAQRPPGLAPVPGVRLRRGRRRPHRPAEQRLAGRALLPPRHHRPRVVAARRRADGDPRLRRSASRIPGRVLIAGGRGGGVGCVVCAWECGHPERSVAPTDATSRPTAARSATR